MTSILIKQAVVEGKVKDIFIEDSSFKEISDSLNIEADHKIDGTNCALTTSFVNAHAHSAMTLFRGFADDLPLQEWLEGHIWPKEAKLDSEMISAGTKLAILEMIGRTAIEGASSVKRIASSAEAIRARTAASR